jgi:hypothetical protein
MKNHSPEVSANIRVIALAIRRAHILGEANKSIKAEGLGIHPPTEEELVPYWGVAENVYESLNPEAFIPGHNFVPLPGTSYVVKLKQISMEDWEAMRKVYQKAHEYITACVNHRDNENPSPSDFFALFKAEIELGDALEAAQSIP